MANALKIGTIDISAAHGGKGLLQTEDKVQGFPWIFMR